MMVFAMTGICRRNFVGDAAIGTAADQGQGLTQVFVDAGHGFGGSSDGGGQPGVIGGSLPFAVFLGVAFIVADPMLKEKANLFGGFHGHPVV